MGIDSIEQLLHDCFSPNRGLGVSVVNVCVESSCVDLRVTFFSGHHYCCAEPGCHFSLEHLRQLAQQQNIVLPSELRVRFHGVVEDGALLESLSRFGLQPRSGSYEFDAEFIDGKG